MQVAKKCSSQEVTLKQRLNGKETSHVKSRSKGSPGRRGSTHKGPGAGKDFGNVPEIERAVWLRQITGSEVKQAGLYYCMHIEAEKAQKD